MSTEPRTWTVPELLQLSGGYWGACALHAAVRLDVITRLDDGGTTTAALAAALPAAPRGVERLLEALAALGWTARQGETWTATPFAARYLSRRSPEYLGHIISHHHLLMDGWSRLHEAVTSGAPVRERSSHSDDALARESFLLGMHDLASFGGPRVAAAVDLTGRRRLLDVGGGPGTYAIHFCLRNPHLTAVVCDLPSTRGFAERTIAQHGLEGRVTFAAADFGADPLPYGCDVAWLSHVLHGEGPAAAAALVAKAAAAVGPGGLVLVQEFILADDRLGPPHPALFGLNMLIGTPDGQAYSGAELAAMLRAAGAGAVERLPLDLPNGAGVLAATVGAPAG